ncbi:MAG: hypothetical protein ACP5TE_06350 [Verrucomicrobiia bacterium]
MRKILDNPYFVGVLVILALIVAFRKPLFSWFEGMKSVPAVNYISTNVTALTEKVKPQSVAQIQPEILPDSKIETQSIQWILTPTRNPFRSVIKKGLSKTNVVEEVSPQPGQQFNLSAVVIEKNKKFAVINGKVLSEGDSISGYRVIKIERDSVELEGFNAKRTLTFGDNGSQQTKK